MRVSEFPALQVLAIPDSADVLRVVEYQDFRGSGTPNLFRLSPDGREVWASAPPGEPDAYVSVELADDGVRATTHYGWRVSLDAATGEIRGATLPDRLHGVSD